MNAMLLLGVLLTVFYGVGAVWLLEDTSFSGLGPNGVGDFLAGIFSPLAFLWLVLGYCLQRRELRASRDALMLQAEELKNAVKISEQQLQFKIQETDRERKKAQPFFNIESSGLMVNSQGTIAQKFRLTNHRHEALDVRFYWEAKLATDLASRVPSIQPGEAVEFQISSKKEQVQTFLLEVACIDGAGEWRLTQFLFERTEDVQAYPIYAPKRVDGSVVRV